MFYQALVYVLGNGVANKTKVSAVMGLICCYMLNSDKC